jgi:hypothetical protein
MVWLHIHGVPLATEPDISLIIFTTNEDIATKFEADLPHRVRNVTTTNVFLFKVRCNIFTGVRINKEMPKSVSSGTSCICSNTTRLTTTMYYQVLASVCLPHCLEPVPNNAADIHQQGPHNICSHTTSSTTTMYFN